MKYDKKMIREAIKARVNEYNEFALYGRYPSTRWDRIPEYHFYFRNNKLQLKVTDTHGEVVDESGNVIVRYIRRWSAKKVRLTYKELMPKLEWAV